MEGFPTPIGVFLAKERLTYEVVAQDQLTAAKINLVMEILKNFSILVRLGLYLKTQL